MDLFVLFVNKYSGSNSNVTGTKLQTVISVHAEKKGEQFPFLVRMNASIHPVITWLLLKIRRTSVCGIVLSDIVS